MRQLEGKERELTEKGLKKAKTDISQLKGSLEYNKSLIEKQDILRQHDDKWRNYLRLNKDTEDQKVIKALQSEVDLLEEKSKQLHKHLTEGVEQKTPIGIN